MKSLAVIHLSDLHLRERTEFDTNSILGSLVKHMKRTISDQHLDAPFIAISGDLTYKGKPEEFDLVKEFIGVIKDEIKPVGMILCPGNHDMNWDAQSNVTCRNSQLMDDLIEHQAIHRIEEGFLHEIDQKQLTCGMVNYHDFLNEKQIGQKYDPIYMYSLMRMDFEKFTVNFVSMNSAYLFSQRHFRFGYIGKRQIERSYAEAQRGLQNDQQMFNVAVFHHSFESIAPASQTETENLIKSRFKLILSGHVHNLNVYMDLVSNLEGENKRRPIISCTRCVYDEKADPNISPGYSIFRIDFDVNTVGPIAIYESKYDRNTREWVRDPYIEYPIRIGDVSRGPKPELLKSPRQMYLAGIRIATIHAHKNLIVYQRTPSLLLGSQPYDKTQKYDYEELFISCLKDKIKNCVENKNRSILYLFSVDATKQILEDERYSEIREKTKKNIKELKQQEEESDHHFRIEPVAFRLSGPLMVGDSSYMVWVGSRTVGKDTEIMVLASEHSAETEEMIRDLGGKFAMGQSTAEELLSLLGLEC